jgi:hypothetical protein
MASRRDVLDCSIPEAVIDDDCHKTDLPGRGRAVLGALISAKDERPKALLFRAQSAARRGSLIDAAAPEGVRASTFRRMLIDAPALKSGVWRTQVDDFARTLTTSAPAPATA